MENSSPVWSVCKNRLLLHRVCVCDVSRVATVYVVPSLQRTLVWTVRDVISCFSYVPRKGLLQRGYR